MLPLQGVWLHCLAQLHLRNWRSPDNKQPSTRNFCSSEGGEKKAYKLDLKCRSTTEVCHLSVSAFTYFFSQLIIDSLEMIFYSSLFFFIEVFGCFLWKKKTYDALTLHFFLEGTFDWSLISQASPQWMDPRVDLTQVLSISRSALLSLIRGLHVWGKNAHRARCTY